MLNERTLIFVSLGVSLVGICALCIILLTTDLPPEHLTAISTQNARTDERVVVRAEVVNVRHVKNITLLRLAETIERDAVVFDDVNLSVGMIVEATGDVQMRDETPELVVRRLETHPQK